MASTSLLPQPTESQQYKYITHDHLDADWLGSASRLMQYFDGSFENDESTSIDARYEPGALVWVLQSKGRQHANFNTEAVCSSFMLNKKRRDKKDARVMKKKMMMAEEGETSNEHENDDANRAVIEDELEGSDNIYTRYHSRSEWFQRARVVRDDDPLEDCASFEQRMQRRVKVRYSRGSTYRVRAYNLVPVIEQSIQTDRKSSLPPMVIVTPETNIYRRISRAHTTPDDSFMEIGCDYGITVEKIRKCMEDAGVPVVWPVESTDGIVDLQQKEEDSKASCLGVDRSKESIGIANERFPQCKFSLCNVLKPDELASLNKLCQQSLKGGAPSVIAIDINGNRDVDGVLECLQAVMNEKWIRHPRLIVVKSRFLYWDLRKIRK
ncbi:hypothetical protein ACHAWO_003675 [Cyclotella atomus]|uniref:Uncharacterized protein n=1 Tax=Cyclotella atomus TaxID=382360 RepID=A0ABD3N2B1_9STRA